MTPARTALLALALVVATSSVALSGEPKPPLTDDQVVHAAVLKRLIERHEQRAMFSRARVRAPTFRALVERALHVDARGDEFRAFRVSRDGEPHLEGCLYPAERAVYVRTLGVDKPRFVPAAEHPSLKPSGLPFPGTGRNPHAPQARVDARASACVDAAPRS